MEYRVEFTPLASLQADEIRDWIAGHSEDRAEKWERSLLEAIESIRSLPRRCPVAPETVPGGEEIRELLSGKRQATYRILYTIRDELVIIVSVRHASRGEN